MSAGRLRGRAFRALALAAALLCLGQGVAAAKGRKSRSRTRRVKVVVVEVAGGRAYLKARAKQPLAVGDSVTLRGHRYRVVASNAKNAVVVLEGRSVKRGQRGLAVRTKREGQAQLKRFVAPPGLETYANVWPTVAVPAMAQSPKHVPLGAAPVRRRSYAMLMADYALNAPFSGTASAIGRTRLRARLHWEMEHGPLSVDADGFFELWHAADLAVRPENASRPLLNLRQLELGYRGRALRGAVGRLRYASANSGMLDGLRLRAPLGGSWSLSAFGGVLPDVRGGGLRTDVSRFGAEASYQSQSEAQLRGSIALQGSRYEGALDERRLIGVIDSFPAFGRLGARAEVSWFDPDNPWGAQSTELTALGGHASFKWGEQLRFNAAVNLRRPERSRWLAAALPSGFFCAAQPEASTGLKLPCAGGDQRLSASGTATWTRKGWALSAGSSGTKTVGANAEQLSAFLNLRLLELVHQGDVDAGVSASTGSFMDRLALNVGAGSRLFADAVDASVYYRPVVARYRAGAGSFVEHGLGARLFWSPAADFDLNLSADAISGSDVSLLTLHGGLAWRPRF